MWKIIFLLLILLLIKVYPTQKPIFSGPYQAIKCGLKNKNSINDTFIFDSKNGYLYYFDISKDEFKPLRRRNNKGVDFYSMEELTSRLEVNRLLGNKLVITYIDYLNKKNYNQSVIKKTIHLRRLIMYTRYKENDKKTSSQIKSCIWIDPKKS